RPGGGRSPTLGSGQRTIAAVVRPAEETPCGQCGRAHGHSGGAFPKGGSDGQSGIQDRGKEKGSVPNRNTVGPLGGENQRGTAGDPPQIKGNVAAEPGFPGHAIRQL